MKVEKVQVEDKDWISVKDEMPKAFESCYVKYDDGEFGEGHFKTSWNRDSWMTRKETAGFVFNLAWSGIRVTHWKYQDESKKN